MVNAIGFVPHRLSKLSNCFRLPWQIKPNCGLI
jgi:hypothetical protein